MAHRGSNIVARALMIFDKTVSKHLVCLSIKHLAIYPKHQDIEPLWCTLFALLQPLVLRFCIIQVASSELEVERSLGQCSGA